MATVWAVRPCATVHRTVVEGIYNGVRDRNLVDVAALQFVEEVPKIHSCYLLGPICSGPESNC